MEYELLRRQSIIEDERYTRPTPNTLKRLARIAQEIEEEEEIWSI